jgi:hypothetical protein
MDILHRIQVPLIIRQAWGLEQQMPQVEMASSLLLR